MFDSLVQQLSRASTVVLSTHRHCDGDGLGAQLALLHGLQQLGKQATVINPDRAPKKYAFLNTDSQIGLFGQTAIPKADLAVILDTNDRRLVEPLMSELERTCSQVVFIDHHPLLQEGPAPLEGSLIDTSAASTGEIVYRLLLALGVQLNATIARALYTSLVFDTQLFRYVKTDPRSHAMAVDLLRFEREPEDVHRKLFATYTVEKMSYLAKALSRVEYSSDGRVAVLQIHAGEAKASGLEADETGDIIDLVMNIESIEVAGLLREDAPGEFKLSLRSKGRVQVLPLAEKFGGGGHPFASGAYLRGEFQDLRSQLFDSLILIATAASLNQTRAE